MTFFPYDLDRDQSGNWVGALRPRLILGMVVWLVIVLAWLAGATAITTGFATRAIQKAQTITVDPNHPGLVSGSSLTRQVVCNNGGDLTVDGNENEVTVSGHCAHLTINGIDNTVTVESVHSVTLAGIDDHVTYHSGKPTVTDSGIDNTVTRG